MARRLIAALLLCLAGCQQEMARQPNYRPLQPSPLFPDGLSARPLVPGTIHRDFALEGTSGKKPLEVTGWTRAANALGKIAGTPLSAAAVTEALNLYYVDAYPIAITEAALKRGQERFNIYCALCHDRVGTGHGMIVQRGYTVPPNFHTDLSRGLKLRGMEVPLTKAPIGYFFEVITNGFGAMPDYASQVTPDDRWRIIAYIRALQLSQMATLEEVRDPAQKKMLLDTREKKK
jgi:mono/diheme cytochrome c family protein